MARLRLGDSRDRRQRHGRDRRRADADARTRNGKPKAIVLRTLPGKGVPRIETSEKSHFFRVDVGAMGRHHRRIRADAWEPSHERVRWRPASTLAMGQDEATGSGRQRSMRRSARRWQRSGRARPDIVGLTADLGKYTDILPFRDAFPDRFFNVGMAEQNLVAVAAGLARTGKVPFATTYGVFATRRAYDFVAIALRPRQPQRQDRRRPARPHDRLWRHAPGDRGPGADAHDPRPHHHRSLRRDRDRGGDARDRRPSTARSTCGCCAARCRSCSTRRAIASRSARRGGCATGSDVGIISTGFMTERALDAADALRQATASRAGVLHVPTIKPFDAEAVIEFAGGSRPYRHGREPRRRRRPRRASWPRRCSMPAWRRS